MFTQQLIRAYFDYNAFAQITALGKAKVLFFGEILFEKHLIGLLLFTGFLTGIHSGFPNGFPNGFFTDFLTDLLSDFFTDLLFGFVAKLI